MYWVSIYLGHITAIVKHKPVVEENFFQQIRIEGLRYKHHQVMREKMNYTDLTIEGKGVNYNY